VSHLLVSVAGIGVGVSLRRRVEPVLALVVRLQYVLVSAPLSFLAGLLFQFRATSVGAIALLQAGEIAAILLGALLYRRSGRHGIAFAAGCSNSGIWSIPLAAAFLGPGAVAFLAVFGSFGFVESAILTRCLRAYAPEPPERRTALADYASVAALLLGIACQLLAGRPAQLLPVLTGLAVVGAVSGAAVIGLAAPVALPGRGDLRAGLHGVALRFGVVFPLLLGVALATGAQLPRAAWLVALAPCYGNMLTGAALYGYRRREAAAAVLATTAVAAPLVPLALLLGAAL
jgi:hypothetical protein